MKKLDISSRALPVTGHHTEGREMEHADSIIFSLFFSEEVPHIRVVLKVKLSSHAQVQNLWRHCCCSLHHIVHRILSPPHTPSISLESCCHVHSGSTFSTRNCYRRTVSRRSTENSIPVGNAPMQSFQW